MTATQILLMDGLSDKQKMILQMEYKEKTTGMAYLFWFFLGAHKAYMGDWGKQILFWFTLGGLTLWWIADLFRMQTLINRTNEKLFNEAIMKAKLVS
jgi:TM2 domain-containing membrane protein YozV